VPDTVRFSAAPVVVTVMSPPVDDMLLSVTVPLLSLSLIETAPQAVAVMLVAVVGLPEPIFMPTEPTVRLRVETVSAPAVVTPLAAPASVSVKVDPELAFSVIALLAVSVTFTVPVALAAKVVAVVLLIKTLPEPPLALREAVVRTLLLVTPVLPDSEMDVGKL
jgi:hypothetical protein